MFKRDYTTSLQDNNCFTLNNEHDWEDLCVQLRHQQTMHFRQHVSKSWEVWIFNPVFSDASSWIC